MQPTSSWETLALQKQLARIIQDQWVLEAIQGYRVPFTLSDIPTKNFNSPSSSHAAGEWEYARKTCNRRNHTQRAWFPVNRLPSSQERWMSEVCNKSQELKQVCLHRALQNGGYTHPERPAKSRRLDDKGGPGVCILQDTSSQGGQSFPQVLVQREDIPI